VPKDYAEAVRWFRRAADQGDAKGEYGLGFMYDYGQGVPRDYAQALDWYGNAAAQSDAKAQEALGSMYYYGRGVQKDSAEALVWYRKAANQAYPNAQDDLGLIYLEGRVVPQDYAEAIRWFRKAVEQGYPRAEYNLGYMYYYGRGVAQDRVEAVRWYEKAADQGDEYAQRALSVRLSTSGEIFLLIQLLGSAWLAFDSLPLKALLLRKNPQNARNSVILGSGALLCAISAGFNWYGYSHYQFRCIRCGLSAPTLLHWILDLASLAALVYIVILLEENKHGRSENGIDEDADSAAASGSKSGSL
jgi:TPR repeat protein